MTQRGLAADNALRQQLAARETHGRVTLLAAVCSDPDVQHVLPQISLARDDRF